MSSIADQIKQHLSQPDFDASQRRALAYLDRNHPFSQSTLSLADAIESTRRERDGLRDSVRNCPRLQGTVRA
jgi:hypothetical protein